MAKPVVEFLQIEPTTRCNYTCGFCAGRHMPQQHMSFEVFEKAIRSVQGVRHIELQGEGEPLLHPRFFDMVDLAKTVHPKNVCEKSPLIR